MKRLALLFASAMIATGCSTPSGTSAAPSTTPSPPGAAGQASGSASAAPPSAPATGTLGIWREFIACANQHGVTNWPDPVIAADGTVTFPPVNGFELKLAYFQVGEACGKILDRLPPGANPFGPPASVSPEHLRALREYAKCMREHGYTGWPDPDARGTFPGGEPYAGSENRDAARQACDQILAPR